MGKKHFNKINTDILIAGAGFAGSLTALCLQQCGFDVCLVEKVQHPRFAIGESSTPIADMILRDLADQYSLPWLQQFSRYGSWQDHHPEITCGLKRGFSYYKHEKGDLFSTTSKHKHELLVAASADDQNSDTNWLRSQFDAFLVKKVKEHSIPYFDNTEFSNGHWNDEQWIFKANRGNSALEFHAEFLIDATGNSSFLEDLLGLNSSNKTFQTNTRAIFSHFEGVKRWTDQLKNIGISDEDYPYDPDHSALHHLIAEGWVWMLRFNNERTSMGIVLDQHRNSLGPNGSPEKEWEAIISSYPSIQQLLHSARYSEEPGHLIKTERLQRKLSQAVGEGWTALPHTVGFVDPLHSTGIAHTLSGVEKIVEILEGHWKNKAQLKRALKGYEKEIFSELELIDYLVSGCYQAEENFELFNIWTMLYSIAAISYEQERLKGRRPDTFLSAGKKEIRQIVIESRADLQELLVSKPTTKNAVRCFRESVKRRIAPYNVAGLLDPETPNMYHHTAVEL